MALSSSQSPKSGSSHSDENKNVVGNVMNITGRNPLKAGQVIPTILSDHFGQIVISAQSQSPKSGSGHSDL